MVVVRLDVEGRFWLGDDCIVSFMIFLLDVPSIYNVFVFVL